MRDLDRLIPFVGKGHGLSLVCPSCRAALHPLAAGRATCTGCGASYSEQRGILQLLAGRAGAPGFAAHYFDDLAPAEAAHFWFVTRRRLILDVMRAFIPDLANRRLFDIGCGGGSLLSFLAKSGVPVAGACDAYVEGLQLARERLPEVPLIQVDEGRLPPLGPGQAMISMFDVLEHLDDDGDMLRFIESVLEPGGILVLTVPAHPGLFDEMDVLAHHRRRYTRSQLRGKLERAGFRVRFLSHFMLPLAPALFLIRWLGRRAWGQEQARDRRASELRVPVFNGLLTTVLGLERHLLRYCSLPMGTSIMAVAARDAPAAARRSGPDQ